MDLSDKFNEKPKQTDLDVTEDWIINNPDKFEFKIMFEPGYAFRVARATEDINRQFQRFCLGTLIEAGKLSVITSILGSGYFVAYKIYELLN